MSFTKVQLHFDDHDFFFGGGIFRFSVILAQIRLEVKESWWLGEKPDNLIFELIDSKTQWATLYHGQPCWAPGFPCWVLNQLQSPPKLSNVWKWLCVFFTKFIYMSDHPQICILSTRQNIDCGEVDPGGYYVDEMLLFHYAECRDRRPQPLIVEYN